MKKQDLIDMLVKKIEHKKESVSRTDIETVMKAFIETAGDVLEKDGIMQITGLGRFKVNTRTGCINPQSKEKMPDKAIRYVSFTQSQAIKCRLND